MQRIIKLDTLIVMSHAAGYSAYNNIKHIWSPLSSSLTGFILPAVLPGEDKAPSHQNVKQAEKKAKQVGLFDSNNINELVHKFENCTNNSSSL